MSHRTDFRHASVLVTLFFSMIATVFSPGTPESIAESDYENPVAGREARAVLPTFAFERFAPVYDPGLSAPQIFTSVVDIDGDGDDEVIVDELDWRDPANPWHSSNTFIPHPVWVFDLVNGQMREISRSRLPTSLKMTWIVDMGRAADFSGDGITDLFIGESGPDCCARALPGGPSVLLFGKQNGALTSRKTPGDKKEFTRRVHERLQHGRAPGHASNEPRLRSVPRNQLPQDVDQSR